MASRTLLCVEPEESAVSEIRVVLEPYGFEVTNIPNGEAAIEWARQNTPDLVIVSVEPRKVGYAVCNKLKRSPELQNIPLILTSGEETPQTFEQHKKLRSRADEYILKPFRTEELLAKVGTLVRLGAQHDRASDLATAEPDDLPADVDMSMGNETPGSGSAVAAELNVGDSDIVSSLAKTPSPISEAEIVATAANPTLDPMFDQETDAAFAALQVGPSDSTIPTPVLHRSSNQSGGRSVGIHGWDDEKTSTSFFTDAEYNSEPPTPPPVAPSAEHLSLFANDGDHGSVPTPEEVSVTSALPVLPDPAAESRIADLTARISTLENERHGLHGQIDELKQRLQSQPLSKEREFLTLRETINRKEKDLLDLRDVVDAKDRHILDQKDRVREHERARRDFEERMLDFEKNLMSAQERMAALAHDKDKAVEREKSLKARLDDALAEIQKTHDEADALKKRLAHAEERARADLEKLRIDLEGRLAEADERHRDEAARLSDERVEAEEDLKSEFEGEIGRLRAAHAAELESLTRKLGDERNSAEERWQAETAQRRKEHEKALVAAREEQALQLGAERQAHQAAVEAKEQSHRGEILGLRRRLEDELSAAEERRQRELAEAETRRVAELDAGEQRRRSELQAREEEHHAKLAEMDRRHLDEQTQQGERHRQEQDQAHARAARAEGELAARSEELSEAQRRLLTLAADRDALRDDLRDREVKLGQLRDRTSDLEGKVTEYEGQILRLYEKHRSDEKVVDRAKRALAVALNLLDDRAGNAPAAAAAAPVAPSAPLAGSAPAAGAAASATTAPSMPAVRLAGDEPA
jgi:DNA-binding response OmpR family regulator/predicted  nucleic acid-binding Zn-ribbon protein